MRNPKSLLSTLLLSSVVVTATARAHTTTQSTRGDLGGTSWQLVKFQGGDGAMLTPDNKAKYTIILQTGRPLGSYRRYASRWTYSRQTGSN